MFEGSNFILRYDKTKTTKNNNGMKFSSIHAFYAWLPTQTHAYFMNLFIFIVVFCANSRFSPKTSIRSTIKGKFIEKRLGWAFQDTEGRTEPFGYDIHIFWSYVIDAIAIFDTTHLASQRAIIVFFVNIRSPILLPAEIRIEQTIRNEWKREVDGKNRTKTNHRRYFWKSLAYSVDVVASPWPATNTIECLWGHFCACWCRFFTFCISTKAWN